MSKSIFIAVVFGLFSFQFQAPRFSQTDENPAIYFGTTFGHYVQRLHKLGRYEEMLEVTSFETIKKYGRDKLLMFYEQMDFSYTLKLKSMNSCTLFYETVIFGTTRTLKFHFSLENGKCRVVFFQLDPKNPFS
jgi:hypothetical protein